MKQLKNHLKMIIPLWVIGGVFGYIYEVIFYYFDKGIFINRGSTFGPWIPIYGFGSILIYLFTKHLRKSKVLVFAVSLVVCGILEFLTGYCLYYFSHVRLWDYNTEILNYGNIGGFICLRSILMWGLCGLLLNYFIVPQINKIYSKYNVSKIFSLFLTVSLIFLIDFFINIII